MRLGVVPTAATYGAVPLSDELKADVVGYCSMARRTHWPRSRDFGPRFTADVRLNVAALHLVHQVIA
jgi:hypothetical protein